MRGPVKNAILYFLVLFYETSFGISLRLVNLFSKFYLQQVSFLELDQNEYDLLIEKSYQATPFHQYEWLKIISNSFSDYTLKILTVRLNGKMIAALPQFYPKGRWYFVSSILGCYGGWISSKPLPVWLRCVICFASSFDVYLFLPQSHEWFFCKKQKQKTWMLKLNSYSAFFNNLNGKTRNQVRKGHKTGVEVRPVDLEFISQILDLYRGLIQKHNIVTQYPPIFFKSILGAKSVVRTLGAFYEGNLIAVSVFVRGKKQVFYYMNMSDSRYSAVNGNNVILDYIIRECCDKGDEIFNFGASPLGNSGLEHFKKSWGADSFDYLRVIKWDFLRRK